MALSVWAKQKFPDHRFFRKGLPRTHHLHIVEQGSASLTENLAFRDALRTVPELLWQYAALKAELATCYQDDRAAYSVAKNALVEKVLVAWQQPHAGR